MSHFICVDIIFRFLENVSKRIIISPCVQKSYHQNDQIELHQVPMGFRLASDWILQGPLNLARAPLNSHGIVGSSTVDAMSVFRVSDVPLLPGRYKVVAHLPATRLASGHIRPGVIIPVAAHWSLLTDPTVVSYLWEGHHVFLRWRLRSTHPLV